MQQNTVAKVVKNHISEILAIVFKISKRNTISTDSSVIGARAMSPLPVLATHSPVLNGVRLVRANTRIYCTVLFTNATSMLRNY